MLSCVALQLGLTQVHFDQLDRRLGVAQDQEGVIQEVILLSLFYSQGFLDELSSRGKVKAVEGRQAAVILVFVWGIIVPSLCLTPIPRGNLWGTGPRYPTYNGIAGAHFVMRTWLILGVCFYWWRHQSWHIPFGSTAFPFMLYIVHWLPIDAVLGFIYDSAPGSVLKSTPWFVALLIALIASVGATVISQQLLQWLFPQKPNKDAFRV